jgi:pimeloyl-ACP methyl ester carboxylesterase
MLGRRVPLALHGYGYATRHYQVDPARVYVAGFSGGGRTAQLVAFAWPDIFRGVLMFAGSDPFGDGAVAPPPRELMKLVQTRLRVVQSTGMADEVNIAIDGRTRRSLAGLCIGNVTHVDQPGLGHGLPRAVGFDKALKALLEPAARIGDDAQCNARLQARIDSELAEVDRLITVGRQAQARKRLLEVDAHYGGLAAPGSLDAMRRLSGRAAGSATGESGLEPGQ